MSDREGSNPGDRWDWLADRLMMLLGRHAESQDQPSMRAPRASIEWLYREARAELSAVEEARLAERSERFVARVMPKLTAAALSVRDLGAYPALRPPAARGTASQVMRIAAALRAAPFAPLAAAAGTGLELWDTVCEDWITLPDDMPSGDYVALKASGDSMLPLLHSGDILLVKVGRRPQVSTVVVARVPEEGYVVKRVAELSRGEIALASLNSDFANLRISASEGLVLGTVVARWCSHMRT